MRSRDTSFVVNIDSIFLAVAPFLRYTSDYPLCLIMLNLNYLNIHLLHVTGLADFRQEQVTRQNGIRSECLGTLRHVVTLMYCYLLGADISLIEVVFDSYLDGKMGR